MKYHKQKIPAFLLSIKRDFHALKMLVKKTDFFNSQHCHSLTLLSRLFPLYLDLPIEMFFNWLFNYIELNVIDKGQQHRAHLRATLAKRPSCPVQLFLILLFLRLDYGG